MKHSNDKFNYFSKLQKMLAMQYYMINNQLISPLTPNHISIKQPQFKYEHSGLLQGQAANQAPLPRA